MLGVSEKAVRDAIACGRVERGPDKWIELASAAAAFRASSTGPRNGIGGAAPDDDADAAVQAVGGESLASAKTRKERALADKAEVDAARARSEVVDVAEAGRAWYAAARILRERVLAVPDHAGPALGLSAEQVTGLRGELVRALTDLADTMPELPR